MQHRRISPVASLRQVAHSVFYQGDVLRRRQPMIAAFDERKRHIIARDRLENARHMRKRHIDIRVALEDPYRTINRERAAEKKMSPPVFDELPCYRVGFLTIGRWPEPQALTHD